MLTLEMVKSLMIQMISVSSIVSNLFFLINLLIVVM